MAKKKEEKEYLIKKENPLEFISTGCTLMNCIIGGGFPLRRISNVIGDKSSNKCIRNAYILEKDKGLIKIDDYGENKEYGYTKLKKELYITKDSYNITNEFWKEKVNNTIKITTRHGYFIEGTYEHPIVIWNDNCSFSFKKLKDLKKGDVALIIKGTNIFSNTNESIFNTYSPPKNATNVKEIILPDTITEELATLLGFFVADGNFKTGTIAISNEKSYIRKEIERCLKSFNLKPNKEFGICSIVLQTLFMNLFNNPDVFRAEHKFIPDCIIKSTKEIQIAFIRSLFDCDSYLSDNTIQYITASEKLAMQIQLILLNFGILSTRSIKNGAYIKDKYYDKNYYSINIYADDLINYFNTFGSNKYNYNGNKNKSRRSDYNSIPYVLEKMYQDINIIRSKVGWFKNGKMKNIEGRFPDLNLSAYKNATYPKIKEFVSLLTDFSEYFNIDFYTNLLEKDYHFDFITDIEYRNEEVDVNDVCIPDTHMFWSNGFVSHNTGNSIEAMANFRKKYPEGNIFYHEVESAFDIPYALKIGMPLPCNKEFDEDTLILIEKLNKKVDEHCFLIEDKEIISEVNDSVFEAIEKSKKEETPSLYILDSLDAVKINYDPELDKGYDGAKRAMFFGDFINNVTGPIKRSNMGLLIISQVRENIGVMFGEKYRRAGGKRLDFHASVAIWLSVVSKIKQTINGIERIVGIDVKANCKKNKISLPFRTCEFPVIFNYGINDVLANLQFLKEVKKLDILNIEAKEIKSLSDELIKTNDIERMNEIAEITIKVWNEIEQSFELGVNKY